MKGDQVLGTLYGASAVPTLDQNEIFARWLQKKLLLTDGSGKGYSPEGAYGPDRQWFQLPSSGTLHGTVAIYDEDGITPLASGNVDLATGKSYQLVIK